MYEAHTTYLARDDEDFPHGWKCSCGAEMVASWKNKTDAEDSMDAHLRLHERQEREEDERFLEGVPLPIAQRQQLTQPHFFHLDVPGAKIAGYVYNRKRKPEWGWKCAYCDAEHQPTPDYITNYKDAYIHLFQHLNTHTSGENMGAYVVPISEREYEERYEPGRVSPSRIEDPEGVPIARPDPRTSIDAQTQRKDPTARSQDPTQHAPDATTYAGFISAIRPFRWDLFDDNELIDLACVLDEDKELAPTLRKEVLDACEARGVGFED